MFLNLTSYIEIRGGKKITAAPNKVEEEFSSALKMQPPQNPSSLLDISLVVLEFVRTSNWVDESYIPNGFYLASFL